MDQNLKQRLVGASVIVALVVIFVPMLFDGAPRQGEHQVELRIPEQPNLPPLEKRRFGIDEPINAKAEPPSPQSIPLEPAIEPEKVMPVQAAEKTHHETIRQQLAARETDPADRPTADATPAQPVETEIETASTSDHPVPANTGDVDNTDSEGTVYRIKIGSFSQRANAEKVRGKLLLDKLPSLVVKDQQRALFHVYSPVFYSKQQADEFAGKVSQSSRKQDLGLGKPAIMLQTPEESRKLSNQAAKAWVVQVGSFSSLDNAKKLRDKLRARGYVTFVDRIQRGGKTFYRVRVGPEVKQSAAEEVRDKLNKKLQIRGVVRPHDLTDVME